mgnify:FL=1|tara:strand:- start:1014 stop:1901 length:888 start_codon:yes stop_codon:yes gene_type:complete
MKLITEEKKIKNEIKDIFKKSLRKLNISGSDNVYLSLNMGGIFKPFLKNEKFIQKVNQKKKYYTKWVLKLLEKYFKKGTMISPAFSYSFIENKFFDIKKTPSDLGVFSQVFLEKRGIMRTDHPIHSICVYGKLKKKFSSDHGKYSFGTNSPFDKFLKYNIKFLNIGVPFGNTCTYVHHIEHLNGSNYRFYKLFLGKVKKNNKIVNSYCYDFVRYRQVGSEDLKNEKLIEFYLKKNKSISYSNDKIFFSCTKSIDVYKIATKLLKKNSHIFLKKNFKILHNDNNTKKNIIKIKLIR